MSHSRLFARTILLQGHENIEDTLSFQKAFKKPPKPTFRKGTNLKQMLVKVKLPRARPVNTRQGERENRRGVSRCNRGTGRNQCGACAHLTDSPREVIKQVAIHSSGEVIQIQDQINCKTKSVLYLLQSRKDPSQYAGQTGATRRRHRL